MVMNNEFMKPDFVLVGVDMSDGQKMLMASDDLTYAELRSIVDSSEVLGDHEYRFLVPGRTRYEIEGHMGSIVFVIADTYSECFARLMSSWKPKQSDRSLVEGVAGIGVGK